MPHWKYQIFQCDDYLIYGNLLDTTVRQSFICNSYEEDILFQRIAFFLTGDTVCLDIGANYGFHTMGVLSLSAKYKPIMHMIEPNKDCVHCLKKTIEKNSLDNVFIHDLALDKEEGEAIFQCDNLQTVTGSLGNFSIAQYKKKQRAEKWDHYSVQKVSLDRWMEDNSIASVRVMKLDTSGYDWNIYQGARRSFQEGRVEVVFFDLLKEQLFLHCSKPSQIIHFFKENDYQLFYSLSEDDSVAEVFNVEGQECKFRRMDVADILTKEDCYNSYAHVHGMAIHSSYLNSIKVSKYA